MRMVWSVTLHTHLSRMKMRRHRLLVLCLSGLCIFYFFNYYKALHHEALLWNLSRYSSHLAFFSSVVREDRLVMFKLSGNPPPHLGSRENIEDVIRQWTNSMQGAAGSAEEPHKRTFVLQDDVTSYFTSSEDGALCFSKGLKMTPQKTNSVKINNTEHQDHSGQQGTKLAKCVCREGWHGGNCGVPTVVQHSDLPTKLHLKPRKVPRRVINAININHEFDLLHARFHELADAVDVFLVCESNYTAYGDPRPLTFLRLLLNGTFDYIKDKIVYIFLDHFPNGGHASGWIADDYLRTFLTKNGLLRVEGLRADDVFILDDADEIPMREGILFLKLYDGWTEPVAIHMRKTLYGFFWKQQGTLNVLSGCTVAMLLAVYQGNGILLRRRDYYTLPGFREYENISGRVLTQWSIGSLVHHAGWHCSWCFKPEGIYKKLVSAQNGDFPRWGDYEEKRKLSYIKELIRVGGWFDGTVNNYPQADPKEPMFAPKYFLDNYEKYRYLLENPYTKQ